MILLIDIDSIIPNLALKKIEKYYLDKGEDVIWNMPLMKYNADKIYVSCIFKENKYLCDEWEGLAEIGGSGYDLQKRLSPEIEAIKPKINMGFTTRGCIRKCHFCIVPKKEGNIHAVGDIYDLWDGKSKKLIIMDNNILALPEHFFKISRQLKKENLKVDFNQGLDHRLLTPQICTELASLKHSKEIRFAFDNVKNEKTVRKALAMLKKHGIRSWRTRWYVYIGESDTIETVNYRLNILREARQAVYIMRDSKVKNKKWCKMFSAYGNCMGAFKMATLKDLIKTHKRFKDYSEFLELI